MIIKEFFSTRKDGVNLYRTYSDKGLYILQNETNIEYAEAVDVENAPYTYSETDKPIEEDTSGWTQEVIPEESSEEESYDL